MPLPSEYKACLAYTKQGKPCTPALSLLRKQQLAGFDGCLFAGKRLGNEPVKINAATDARAGLVVAMPAQAVETGLALSLYQRRDQLAASIENLHSDCCALRQRIADVGGWIERIGMR